MPISIIIQELVPVRRDAQNSVGYRYSQKLIPGPSLSPSPTPSITPTNTPTPTPSVTPNLTGNTINLYYTYLNMDGTTVRQVLFTDTLPPTQFYNSTVNITAASGTTFDTAVQNVLGRLDVGVCKRNTTTPGGSLFVKPQWNTYINGVLYETFVGAYHELPHNAYCYVDTAQIAANDLSYNDIVDVYYTDTYVMSDPEVTPTPTVTPSITPSVTPSITPTNTATPSITPSVTPSITPTKTTTPSVTPSITPSITPTTTPSSTPGATPSVTPSITPTNTPTPSGTPSSGPYKYLAKKYGCCGIPCTNYLGDVIISTTSSDNIIGKWFNLVDDAYQIDSTSTGTVDIVTSWSLANSYTSCANVCNTVPPC